MMTNPEIVRKLRAMAAACQMLGENRFKIIAYERAADSIEHLTIEVKDLWDDGKLGQIPGVGRGIAFYLDELLRTGRVGHFDTVMKKVPEAAFPLLSVPGIGPKKAYRLVKALGLKRRQTALSDLEQAAKAGTIATLDGFGETSQEDILSAIAMCKRGAVKENRLELVAADVIAHAVIAHLGKLSEVETIDVLGSLRRRTATIGDIDIAAATRKPQRVIAHFLAYPHEKIIDQGPRGATLLLHNGRQVDLRVQDPREYGTLLQYFTGSKNHNIRLREYANSMGLSLNEYGIQTIVEGGSQKTGSVQTYCTEEAVYHAMGLPWIPPELREDKGEIVAARRKQLPNLVEAGDIRGDVHIHTDFQFVSSHDLGTDHLHTYLDRAHALGYGYIGVSDHNPSVTTQSQKQIIDIMKRRKAYYEHQYSSWSKKVSKNGKSGGLPNIFIMCEVDIQPEGSLALPEQAFEYVDAVVVSIHSSFTQRRVLTTRRVIAALISHPKVRIFGHPTGRLLMKREGIEIDWNEVFAVCREHDIALEINANPGRLDLPDTIVFDARNTRVKFCINTDSHAASSLDLMGYGVAVARRGWCEKRDIVNTMEYTEFKNWLVKN
jgi:DNA polymerase (family 10)